MMDKREASRILYDAMDAEDKRRAEAEVPKAGLLAPVTELRRNLAEERAAYEASIKTFVNRETAQNALNKAFRTERENPEDYLAEALRILVQDARNAERTSW